MATGLIEPTGWLLAAALGAVGVGLGLFVPPNNTTIMSNAPRSQAGSASGVLNMTRGLGTALGLTFTGLVFGAFAGGTSASPSTGGFRAATLFLAGIAALAMVISALPGSRSPAEPPGEPLNMDVGP